MNKIIYILFSCFYLVSCLEPAEFKSSNKENKLVIQAFLIAKKPILVKVSIPTDLESNTFPKVADALVLLKYNSTTDTLTYSNGFYTKQGLMIQENVCYSLEVRHKDFETVYAQDCVPSFIQLDSFRIVNASSLPDSLKYTTNAMYLYFKDPKETTDNYFLTLTTDTIFNENAVYDPFYYQDYSINHAYVVINSYFFYNDGVISDSIFNGEYVDMLMQYSAPYVQLDTVIAQYTCNIARYSDAYKKYYEGLYNYGFLKDPNRMEYNSNIQNGYGIFAGISEMKSITWIDTTFFNLNY